MTPERDLILAAQGGDIAARNELVTRYIPVMRAIARRAVGRHKADEVFGLVALLFLQRLKAYRIEHGVPFKTYCFLWLRLDERKAWATNGAKFARSLCEPRRHSPLSNSGVRARVREAVEMLPCHLRDVVYMRARGLSNIAIADSCGLCTDTVRRRYREGARLLRQVLEAA